METLAALGRNQPLIAALVAWLLAQGLKVFTHFAVSRRIDVRRWTSSGGMPSSHSAFVAALAVGVGLQEGFDSALFAVCLVFGTIVMYDATGVRQAASHQARLVNQIVAELFEGHPISQSQLRELLGHTPIEVILGALLGGLVALVWMARYAPL